MFIGFVRLGDTLLAPLQTVNTSSVPTNADANPRRQVYGFDGSRLTAMNGQSSQGHTGSVTGATNASPIVITSAGHGLQTGARVTITGVGGNTAANGTFNVTRVDANTFSLDGSTGNGNFTTGGTWNLSGYYTHSLACTEGNGFAAGNTYYILSLWAISASNRASLDSFTVV